MLFLVPNQQRQSPKGTTSVLTKVSQTDLSATMKHYVNVPYLANVDAKRAVTLRVMVSKLSDR